MPWSVYPSTQLHHRLEEDRDVCYLCLPATHQFQPPNWHLNEQTQWYLRRQLSSSAPNLRRPLRSNPCSSGWWPDRRAGPPWALRGWRSTQRLPVSGGHDRVQGKSSEVLDIKLVVLRIPEWGIERLDNKIFCTLVCKAYQELHNVICWKI